MSQMQEGEQQEERDLSYWLYRIVKWSTIAMSVAIPLAIAGVALGAVNYMSGPVHYPAWLLATWMVVDILLLVFLASHIVLYGAVIVDQVAVSEPDDSVMGISIFLGVVLLVIGGIMLWLKHLAWLSVIELILLVAATIISVVFLVQMRDA